MEAISASDLFDATIHVHQYVQTMTIAINDISKHLLAEWRTCVFKVQQTMEQTDIEAVDLV